MDAESIRMASLYKLRLVTAQRGGEGAAMRRKDLALVAGGGTVPRDVSKNGNLHRVPLSDLAARILKDVKVIAEKEAKKPFKGQKEPRGMSEWVFPGRKKGQSTGELQKAVQ